MGYPTTVDTGGVSPAIINVEGAAYACNAALSSTANRVYVFAFEIHAQTTITKVRWYMGSTATGKTNMGIYTLAGNLVAGSDTGQVTNVASSENTTTYATPITLSPGQYLIALSPSNSTDTYAARGGLATYGLQRSYYASNTLAAGALPATTGTLNEEQNAPLMALLTQNGLP